MPHHLGTVVIRKVFYGSVVRVDKGGDVCLICRSAFSRPVELVQVGDTLLAWLTMWKLGMIEGCPHRTPSLFR